MNTARRKKIEILLVDIQTEQTPPPPSQASSKMTSGLSSVFNTSELLDTDYSTRIAASGCCLHRTQDKHGIIRRREKKSTKLQPNAAAAAAAVLPASSPSLTAMQIDAYICTTYLPHDAPHMHANPFAPGGVEDQTVKSVAMYCYFPPARCAMLFTYIRKQRKDKTVTTQRARHPSIYILS